METTTGLEQTDSNQALQWGHPGEGMETSDLVEWRAVGWPLQWGHPGEGMETRPSAVIACLVLSFNGAIPVKGWKRVQAETERGFPGGLQWGHPGEGMETKRTPN